MNIAILGFGVVGSAVYELADKNAKVLEQKVGDRISVKRILDIRDFSNHEACDKFSKDFDQIINDPSIEIVVECIGGLHPALEFVKAALQKGKSVVTSNKELVAAHGKELSEIACINNASFLFEASVGGGIPIIRPLKTCLASNNITEVVGILNGTTNFILTKMLNENLSFASALACAQKLGYAESNPSADVDGHDTCRKASILATVAFGEQVACSAIPTQGISKVTLRKLQNARERGCVIKLIAWIRYVNGKLRCSVKPTQVPLEHPLAHADGVNNAILVRGDFVGDVVFSGPGAGGAATASAVVGDVIEIARVLMKRRKLNEILQYA